MKVIGFKQSFDLEADKKSITVRAIGTAVKLSHIDVTRIEKTPQQFGTSLLTNRENSLIRDPISVYLPPNSNSTPDKPFLSPEMKEDPAPIDDISLPSPTMQFPSHLNIRPAEPVILTLNTFPEFAISGTGGYVCAAAIKILDTDTREIRDVRDQWWTEIRDELKLHAKTLGCNYVVGYSEMTSISDEVMLLYCSGTAVNLDFSLLQTVSVNPKPVDDIIGLQSPRVSAAMNTENQTFNEQVGESMRKRESVYLESHTPVEELFESRRTKSKRLDCRSCHITYNRQESPFPLALTKCGCCKKKYVPEILLSTTELPPELKIIGNCVLIEAHVCRQKKVKVGDSRAITMSESIPFAQYDIHRQLMYKLRVYGLNAVFGLKIQITIGDTLLTAVATGTAFYIKALPTPPALKVFRNLDVVDEEDKLLVETQRKLMAKSELNRKKIQECLSADENALQMDNIGEKEFSSDSSDSDDSDQDVGAVVGSPSRLKQRAMVIEIDDEQDEDLVLFLDDAWNENFRIFNLDSLPQIIENVVNHKNFQMVTMVKQKVIDPSHHPNRQLARIFKSIQQELALQMSFLLPCTAIGLSYDIQVPKNNHVQIVMTALVLGDIMEPDLQLYSGTNDFNASIEDLDNINISGKEPVRKYSLTSSIGQPGSRGSVAASSPSVVENPVLASKDSFSSSDKDEAADYEDAEDIRSPGIGRNSTYQSINSANQITEPVELSPSSTIPNTTFYRFLGRISLHFIKEASLVYDPYLGSSGIGGFTHVFMMELLAVVKAHVTCLGGNGMVGFTIDQCQFTESLKNQGYALISVSGDVVSVKYQFPREQLEESF
ncbi:hypothetical protein HDV02_002680 [Globomyces sp. JEL0801]|nr:hypothetical protein HDV02_002680 [Globomyces sp. JEL0801]